MAAAKTISSFVIADRAGSATRCPRKTLMTAVQCQAATPRNPGPGVTSPSPSNYVKGAQGSCASRRTWPRHTPQYRRSTKIAFPDFLKLPLWRAVGRNDGPSFERFTAAVAQFLSLAGEAAPDPAGAALDICA